MAYSPKYLQELFFRWMNGRVTEKEEKAYFRAAINLDLILDIHGTGPCSLFKKQNPDEVQKFYVLLLRNKLIPHTQEGNDILALVQYYRSFLQTIKKNKNRNFLFDLSPAKARKTILQDKNEFLPPKRENHGTQPDKPSAVSKSSLKKGTAPIPYIKLYTAIISQDPGLKPLIDYIQSVPPLYYGELSDLTLGYALLDPAAKERLIHVYMKSAVRIAYGYARNFGIEIADSVQKAICALIETVNEMPLGFSFTAVSSHISAGIDHKLFQSAFIKSIFPDCPRTQEKNIKQVLIEFNQKECPVCNDFMRCHVVRDIIRSKTGYEGEQAEMIISAVQRPVSLDALEEKNNKCSLFCNREGKHSEYPLALVYEDLEEKIESIESEGRTKAALDRLTPRERLIIEKRLALFEGGSLTLAEIGDQLNLTRERVRQIEIKARRKLIYFYRRNPSVKETAKEYTDDLKQQKKVADQKAELKNNDKKLLPVKTCTKSNN